MTRIKQNSNARTAAMALGLAMIVSVTCLSWAQEQSSAQAPAAQQITPGVAVDAARKSGDNPAYISSPAGTPGETWGDFQVKQTAEFGGRISDFTGSEAMWDTFVNLGSGPRLLEYSLDMHQPKHTGMLFDDLTFNNFGYGGDPIDVSRFRISKGTLYNFGASFRRDQNIFDYDLFANPLNPAGSNPTVPILQSPHEFLLTRRMSDANLNLFNAGPVRLRMGWSRVVNEGTVFSTIHQGTEALLQQPTLNTSDSFQGGVSLRLIPRTSIDYDQFYTYFKGDNSTFLAPGLTQGIFGVPSLTLPGGIPVNPGISFNTLAGQPCASPVLGTGLANPACNGFFSQNYANKVRNSYPTEQISFQSSYWRRVDLSGRFNYSDSESSLPNYLATFNGLDTRARLRLSSQSGASLAKRISKTVDFGATIRLTNRLRLIDTFRFNNFAIPTFWNYTTGALFGATLLTSPNVFNPATCPPPFTAATCPQHGTSSGPDLSQDLFNQFIRQDTKVNTVELEYDFTRRVSAYLGYRYERREITDNDSDFNIETFTPTLAARGNCADPTLSPSIDPATGICTVVATDSGQEFFPINANSALFGFSAHPNDKLRFSFDTELYYADKVFTRISPRHLQLYRVRFNYTPMPWANLGAAVNIRENRNNTADVGNLQHNRSYAFTAALAPAEGNWGVDLSYDYNDIFSQTNVCFVATPVPADVISCGTPFLQGLSVYTELAHYGGASIYFKPISRVRAAVGYTVTSSSGNTLILNPNTPSGPLNYNYHLPTANIAFQISKKLEYKTGWNYYDYNEKSSPGPTFPRDFRGNVFTLSLRYSM
jgi:hypothetical protein